MYKIRLFCAGGMSTSLLVTKMRNAAAEQGIDVDIIAHGVGSVDKYVDETVDCVLLGPQIGYQEKQVRAQLAKFNVPIAVIPMTDYGMVNGKNVLALAIKMIEENK